MTALYVISIHLIYIITGLFAIFKPKARLWIEGRRNWKRKLNDRFPANDDTIWFHAASLGEFEQGKPLIEKIRQRYPQYKILLTFYSPSGYEVRKHFSGADYITYLPSDTYRNARYFIEKINPAIVFFIKYEFWYFYLKILHSKNIPVYLISGIFRKDQIFFRRYGGWFRKMLYFFRHLFVQQQESLTLLKKIGIDHATISGDTRFDTVSAAASSVQPVEPVSRFLNGHPCMVAGSTWPEDEKVLLRIFNKQDVRLKLIIAPHEIHAVHIQNIISRLEKNCILYSRAEASDGIDDNQVLIIDNIGLLLPIYRYATIGYVGGGFGKGIHNILEPAAFGIPVIFGPNYQKFNEAIELIRLGGAFHIDKTSELEHLIIKLLSDTDFYKNSSAIAKDYVKSRTGATEHIIGHVFP
ncbi:MAG: 3-deoxy-D-manno-octulosonic acid transferase [Bacteroidales bacterium]|nr:3-deoxy-D-manno-octulosonic acid transferase [Bacteroidales bacterium]